MISRSESRLGIDQFALDPLPVRGLYGTPRYQVDPTPQHSFELLTQFHEAQSDRRIDFYENVDVRTLASFPASPRTE